jgi:F-type H+-transporting ATPase subunit b
MTFLFDVIAFAIILWVLWKYVRPLINRVVAERQEKIRVQFEEAAQAKADAESAESEVEAQMADAQSEAARIREEAQEQGEQIIAQHREQAEIEAERITANAQAQIGIDLAQARAQLQREVGTLTVTSTGRIVEESLDDDARQKRSVERFIAELEDEAGTAKKGS